MSKGKQTQQIPTAGVSDLDTSTVMDVLQAGVLILTVNVHPRAVLVPIPRDEAQLAQVVDNIRLVMESVKTS